MPEMFGQWEFASVQTAESPWQVPRWSTAGLATGGSRTAEVLICSVGAEPIDHRTWHIVGLCIWLPAGDAAGNHVSANARGLVPDHVAGSRVLFNLARLVGPTTRLDQIASTPFGVLRPAPHPPNQVPAKAPTTSTTSKQFTCWPCTVLVEPSQPGHLRPAAQSPHPGIRPDTGNQAQLVETVVTHVQPGTPPAAPLTRLNGRSAGGGSAAAELAVARCDGKHRRQRGQPAT